MVATYRERLVPRWWAWLIVASLVAMLAIAYGGALGSRAGLAVGAAAGALALWLVWITSPTVVVDEAALRAGGATLPRSSIAAVEVLDGAALARERGPGADARVFAVLRPWAASAAVRVDLDDAEDPHPAWLVSTRHPERLARALRTEAPPAED